MKWLLITNTENRNPGDEWIKMGVQRLVRDVDKSPEFIILNKELVEDQSNEVKFDKAIWCGSPLFWSHKFQGCWDNHWWTTWVNSWLYKERNKILVLGVGDVVGSEVHDLPHFKESIELIRSKAWSLVVRNTIPTIPSLMTTCCPSVFALAGCKKTGSKRLANLMPDGAHDGFLNQSECDRWHEIVHSISEDLLHLNFDLVCHAKFEDKFSSELGWPKDRVFLKPETSEDYLPLYQSASFYIGNRLHGAVLARGSGASALAFGYDSRLGMVEYTGGQTCKPTQWKPDTVSKWLSEPHLKYDWEPEYAKQLQIIRTFAEA